MSNHNDLNYDKQPVHEIDRLRAQRDELVLQNGVLRDALVKVADWFDARSKLDWHETARLIRMTLWSSATPEQRSAPFAAVAKNREGVKLCYKCGRQEASKNFAVCPACYKDPVDG